MSAATAPVIEEKTPPPLPRPPRRRWLLRIVLGLVALFVLTTVVLLYVLAHLDAGPIRERVKKAAHESGIDLDYGQASLSLFSGLVLKDLQIASAPEDRNLAPELVHIREVHVGWTFFGLLGKRIDEIGVHGITLTAVQNEQGETSLDHFLSYRAKLSPPQPGSPAMEGPPVSRLVSASLPASKVELGSLVIDEVSARLIRTKEGKPIEQVRAGSLTLSGHASAGAGKLDLELDAGTESKPLPIEVVQESVSDSGSPKRLTALPWAQLKADEKQIALSFAVPIEERSLAPSLPAGNVANGKILVKFNPDQSSTAVSVEQFSLVEGAATATASVDLHDAPGGSVEPAIRTARVHADMDQLLSRLKELVPAGVAIRGGALDLTASDVKMLSSGAAPWMPGAPVTISPGGSVTVDVKVDSLDLDRNGSETHVRGLRLNVNGRPEDITIKSDIQKLTQGPLTAPQTEVEAAQLMGSVTPEQGGLRINLSAPIERASMHGATQLDARKLEVGLSGSLKELSHFDGQLTTSLQSAHYASKGRDAVVSNAHLALKLAKAVLNTASPATSSADATIEADLADVTVRIPHKVVRTRGLKMDLGATVQEGELKSASLALPIDQLSLDAGPEDPHLAPTRARVEVSLDSVAMDLDRPARSRAQVVADAQVGDLHLKANIDKRADSATFDINGDAEKLGALAGLARGSAAPGELSILEQLGVELRTKGTVEHLSRTADLLVDHKTTVVLRRPAVHREGLDFAAKAVTLKLDSHGSLRKHAFDLNVDLDAPRINRSGGDGHQSVALRGAFDMAHPHVDLHLAGSGVTGPDGQFDLAGGYDPKSNVLDWKVDGNIGRLGLIGVVLPPALARKHHLDWESLAIEAHGAGQHNALVKKYRPGSPPQFVFVEDALVAARGTVKLDLTTRGVDYKGENNVALQLPSMALHANSSVLTGKAHVDASVDIPSVHVEANGHKLEGEKLAPSLVVDTAGDRTEGEANVNVSFTAASMQQDWEPGYPIGGVDLKAKASADTRGSVRVERVSFDNKAGGTHLELHGGMDFRPTSDDQTADKVIARALSSATIPGRKNLLIEGSASQNLDVLQMDPKVMKGAGTIRVPNFRIESGDLAYVHVSTTVRFAKVNLALPRSGLAVNGLNGAVRLAQDLFVDDQQHVMPLAGATAAAYTRVRYVDQQPFLSGKTDLSADQILMDLSDDPQHPDVMELKSFNANLHIDRNLIAIDQMEAALAGGNLSGQLLVDYRGSDTELIFHGGVTGLRTSQDPERLDANAAISLKPWKRLLDGRVEVVRLGRGHLNKMLDWYDPYGSDTKANRMRKVMAYGYPKQVRMRFQDGFAGLFVDLGGIGSAVRIDEITTPLGPILERYLARRLRKQEEDQ